ncbi:protein phosphatase 2C family protein [Artemisia annua]|uniref:Protein phosphatase n=1 Tax=Artemisia annua TaxID=35608 RepID=A0A2U1LTK9_ARTAN|nr:protein phosphatase 2C family protein [Artemisia annua]
MNTGFPRLEGRHELFPAVSESAVVVISDGGEVMKFTTEELHRIMDYNRNIRNMFAIAHGDHVCDFCTGLLIKTVARLSGDKLEDAHGEEFGKTLSDRSLKLLSGSCYLPHPDKDDTGGEDAHFICSDEQAIGVPDGVGGWADLGIDAGKYARELMSNSVSAVQDEPKGSVDPARVLDEAYVNTKAKGSSTACIIALTNQVFSIPVAPGDVIVAGTDGLFDNLYNSDITAIVVHAVRAGFEPQVTTQKIAALARQRALEKNRQTPFSAAAQEGGFRYFGGKLDDITIVVSYITATKDIQKHAIGGTVNMNGCLLIKATHIGSKTGLSQIIYILEDAHVARDILEAAHVARAPVQKLANQISRFSVAAVRNLSL